MKTTAESYRYLQDLVYRRSAIVIDETKEYLVESRLVPIAQKEGLHSVEELVQRMRSKPSTVLVTQVVEAMTTNETSFFRDVHPFETLKNFLVPTLTKERATTTRKLRIWCAAASTGQEPYSIAMLIREHFPLLAGWDVQIIATDINATVLARAREATYRQFEVNRGLPATYLVKYFERVGTDWRLKPSIVDMVSFRELNLLETWPFHEKQDIVFMRNVLIYFDVQTKRGILSRVRQILAQDGSLVLGGAETTMNIDEQFRYERAGNTMVYQHRAPLVAVGT